MIRAYDKVPDSARNYFAKLQMFYNYLTLKHLFHSNSRRKEEDTEVCVCIATASPAKFINAVKAAKIEYTPPPEILKLDSMPTRYEHMRKGENWEDILRRKIISIGDGYN